MKFQNGAEISVDGYTYCYNSEHLTIETEDVEEFVTELQDYGVIDEFHVHSNYIYDEVLAVMSTDKVDVNQESQKEEHSLEECYEKVIEHITKQKPGGDKGFMRQVKMIGLLKLNKNALGD